MQQPSYIPIHVNASGAFGTALTLDPLPGISSRGGSGGGAASSWRQETAIGLWR